MKKIAYSIVCLLSVFILTACGGGSSSISTVTGTFIDDPVEGLSYSCSKSGLSGKTDLEGKYTCAQGDEVTFKLGSVVLGTIAAQSEAITPYLLFPNNPYAAIRMAQLIQSVSTDENLPQIVLSADKYNLLPSTLDFTSDTFIVDAQDALGFPLVDANTALERMNTSISEVNGTIGFSGKLPIANAGLDQNIVTSSTITLNAQASSELGENNLSYKWSLLTKPINSNAVISNTSILNPTFTADVDGQYVLGLIVNDGFADSAIDTVVLNSSVGMNCASEPLYPRISTKIINGDKVSTLDTKWSSMVVLLINGTDTYKNQICGGTLIDENWVLTAGHCVYGNENSPEKFSVGYNSYNLENIVDIVGVKRIILHPNYDDFSLDNDLALIELSSSVSSITPMTISSENPLNTDECSMIAGWGTMTSSVKDYPLDLMAVGVPLVSQTTCVDTYKNVSSDITENMFCAGYLNGEYDSCQGDSGGPLIANENGIVKQIGIVSSGEGCAQPNYPGVYTKVQNYYDWIASYVSRLQ